MANFWTELGEGLTGFTQNAMSAADQSQRLYMQQQEVQDAQNRRLFETRLSELGPPNLMTMAPDGTTGLDGNGLLDYMERRFAIAQEVLGFDEAVADYDRIFGGLHQMYQTRYRTGMQQYLAGDYAGAARSLTGAFAALPGGGAGRFEATPEGLVLRRYDPATGDTQDIPFGEEMLVRARVMDEDPMAWLEFGLNERNVESQIAHREGTLELGWFNAHSQDRHRRATAARAAAGGGGAGGAGGGPGFSDSEDRQRQVAIASAVRDGIVGMEGDPLLEVGEGSPLAMRMRELAPTISAMANELYQYNYDQPLHNSVEAALALGQAMAGGEAMVGRHMLGDTPVIEVSPAPGRSVIMRETPSLSGQLTRMGVAFQPHNEDATPDPGGALTD